MIDCKFKKDDLELIQVMVGSLKSSLYPLKDKSPQELSLFLRLDTLDFKLRHLLSDDL